MPTKAPQTVTQPTVPKTRKYTGPPKGSQEAKDRMAKVRAAQWARNGLVYGAAQGPASSNDEPNGEHSQAHVRS